MSRVSTSSKSARSDGSLSSIRSDSSDKQGANKSSLALSAKEQERLNQHHPMSKQKKICLDFNTHKGCRRGQKFDKQHVSVTNLKSLDYTVHLLFATRQGHKDSTKLSQAEAVARQRALRKQHGDGGTQKKEPKSVLKPFGKSKTTKKKRKKGKKVGFSDSETDRSAPSSQEAPSESETEKSDGPKSGWAPPSEFQAHKR